MAIIKSSNEDQPNIASSAPTGRLSSDDKQNAIPSSSVLGFGAISLGQDPTSNEVDLHVGDLPSGNPWQPFLAPVNAQDADTASTPATPDVKVKMTPVQNPLNAYDQPTYSIRLSMIEDSLQSANEIALVETGKTSLFIESLEMDSYPAPGAKNRCTTVQSMNLRVVEPMGANLPDLMIAAARTLKQRNYQKGPWRLSIKFLGYDANTGKPLPILDREWSWTCALSSMRTRVTDAGSVHELDLQPYDDVAKSDPIMRLPETVSVELSPNDTVGSALNKIFDRLNTINKRDNNRQHLEYHIADIPYKHPVANVASPLLHKIDINNQLLKSQRNPGFGAAQGESLVAIIELLFAASPTASAMAFSATRNPDNPETQNVDQLSVFHMVKAKVDIIDYAHDLQDYDRKITYIICPYEVVGMITNDAQATSTTSPERNQAKVDFLIKNGFLQKAYNYVFTGQNTEIIRFDINLQFDWLMTKDNFDGTVHIGQATVPQQASDTQNLGKTSSNPNVPTEKTTAFGGKPVEVEQTVSSVGGAFTSQTVTLTNDARLSQTSKLSQNKTNITYAEDLNWRDLASFDVTPVSSFHSGGGNRAATAYMLEQDPSKQRSVYGLLLNELYRGGGSQMGMVTINMDIRGDPYWLGDDLANPPAIPSTGIDASTGLYPSFYLGEYCFVLRFNIPQGYNDATNTPRLKQNEMFTGIYAVTRIHHKFADGMYTQTLAEAQRKIGITITDNINLSA